ncbi:hypothetical protein BAY60_22670 [Prauserella muralis]|uniref:AB hydrolase-1 domain-containing protein n=2 Tax=Prauserella muralis TaxID=588067 RepID=A0A2V4AQ62_9PSEU|nr:hypothetical protein BAY60_22670 [Prauserella muralis]TWE28336.1 serine aminopeptidase S33 family [Prauserella muralis]
MTLLRKSTIVRAKLASVRLLFRGMERLAPGLGSVIALRLWCTPRHAEPGPRPAAGPGTRYRVPVNGSTVVAETWGHGPVIYLVHGWGGHRDQLGDLVAPLNSAGYQVVAFDAPSHGESAPGLLGPRRANLPEFADALRAAVAYFGPAHAVIAHSLGAGATALAVLDGLPVSRLVLLAPMAEPVAYTDAFAHGLGFGERIRTGFLRRLERQTGRPVADFDIPARAAGRTDLPPVLVVHDRRDREVRYADGVAIAQTWPEPTLVSTDGLGHRRLLRDRAVLGEVHGFVTARDPLRKAG